MGLFQTLPDISHGNKCSRSDVGIPQLPNPPHPTPPQQVLTRTTGSVSSNKGNLHTHLITYSWLYPTCIQVQITKWLRCIISHIQFKILAVFCVSQFPAFVISFPASLEEENYCIREHKVLSYQSTSHMLGQILSYNTTRFSYPRNSALLYLEHKILIFNTSLALSFCKKILILHKID